MTVELDDLLNSILQSISQLRHVSAEDIPNIDLYMDQVTTFIDSKMRNTARNKEEDKILTKTMINNYAKNDLLPPPIKKKYSKEHVILLIFIYYYKGLLSINDIQTLLKPVTENFYNNGEEFGLEELYTEVFSMEDEAIKSLTKDITDKYHMAQKVYTDAPKEQQEFLHLFAFISLLSYDVYVKKLLIEKMIDQIAAREPKENKKDSKKSNKKSEEN